MEYGGDWLIRKVSRKCALNRGERANSEPIALRVLEWYAPRPMSEPTQPLRAVLVGIQTPDMTDEQLTRSLTELGRLAETLGVRVIEQVRQKRECIDAGGWARANAWSLRG